MDKQEIKKSFLKDIQDHQMTIIKDDGVSRHIRFKAPGTMNCYFDLTTWNGHLCITGDMGTYVFSRVEDMFTFFRLENLDINQGYWAEKCLSQSIFGNGIRQYSQKVFEDAVISEFRHYIQSRLGYCDLSDRVEIKKFGQEMRDIWSDIKSSILGAENEWEAMNSVYEFTDPDGMFQDFWETTITEYTYHFLWCLYAIVWGISQYDQAQDLAA